MDFVYSLDYGLLYRLNVYLFPFKVTNSILFLMSTITANIVNSVTEGTKIVLRMSLPTSKSNDNNMPQLNEVLLFLYL